MSTEFKKYDITIKYVDEIRCQILTRKEIMYELKDTYSFFANGYKFHPLFKQGKWSGKISMIDNKGLFYNGLLKDLLRHCKTKGLSIKVEDISRYMPDKIEDEYISKLSAYAKLTPYDYQLKSVKECLEKRKLLVLSPTSSGKSLISFLLYRHCIDNNLPLLITVPSTSLVEQLISDFKSYVSDDHDVDKYVAPLYSGHDKNSTKQVIISTWQSCMNLPPEWFNRFEFYICDEAHTAKAKEISAIIDNLNTCKYRIGMTGTLNGTDIHEIEMHARFGDIFKMVTTRELIDRGVVTDLDIHCQRLVYSKEEIARFHAYAKNEYQKEIEFIINSETRNDYLVNLALTLHSNTLLLVNRVETHGMVLLEMLQSMNVRYKKKIFYITGSIKPKEREIIRNAMDGDLPVFYDVKFDNGSCITIDGDITDAESLTYLIGRTFQVEQFDQSGMYIKGNVENALVTNVERVEGSYILLATYGTLAVGVNIKKLHNLIFGHPLKGKILNLQSIGRILRKSEVKNKVYLYDICDDFRKTKKGKENHAFKHSIARIEIYEEQEFEYNIYEVNL